MVYTRSLGRDPPNPSGTLARDVHGMQRPSFRQFRVAAEKGEIMFRAALVMTATALLLGPASSARGEGGEWDISALEKVPQIEREWQLPEGGTTFTSLKMALEGEVTLQDETVLTMRFLYRKDRVGWKLAREWMQAYERAKAIPSDLIVRKRMIARARENAKLAARHARIHNFFGGGVYADQLRQVELTVRANSFRFRNGFGLVWVQGFQRKDGTFQPGYWMLVQL